MLQFLMNRFVKQFNKDYTAQPADFFCADHANEIIEYEHSGSPINEGNAAFYGFALELLNGEMYSLFLLSLLHELGHLETDHLVEDDMDERSMLFMAQNFCGKDITQEYLRLPSEYMATTWGIDWCINHPIKARIWDKLFSLVGADTAIWKKD